MQDKEPKREKREQEGSSKAMPASRVSRQGRALIKPPLQPAVSSAATLLIKIQKP